MSMHTLYAWPWLLQTSASYEAEWKAETAKVLEEKGKVSAQLAQYKEVHVQTSV